ncbi:DEAD/DEAH box helicase [Bacteroidetes/Chlorobi group bacterium Naka2016]|jgi:hypothetical protein|nr:MAG: DEAD/DEAH box helicase [Bacteroidetes/Chlorobi group bacterium Naka2016]
MSKLYLQNIVESIDWENLPAEWTNFDLAKFSSNKILFDYQQQALKNAIKALCKYYKDSKADKSQFFNLYQNNGFSENLDIDLKNNKIKEIFQEYYKNNTIKDDKIAFCHFINRMSFWMATGSGKTLVIVKLLEILGKLIKENKIPKKDILFLTYREDLLEQFKNHVNEFNNANNDVYINFYDLKNYENEKRNNVLKFGNEIDVYYYRSDLIADEQKDKIIDFRNYDNSGNWYILLDEAHKGDHEDSKRQQYYSILSRNGFLFNFSATFTDDIDLVTCVYNFNLEQFIKNGYGKNIYISRSNIEQLAAKQDFDEQQKQIIILKILLLYTYINHQKTQIGGHFYHKPLLLTLVNSVNTEDSDLFLFFQELKKIANLKGDDTILQLAKNELKNDLTHRCEFTNESINLNVQEIDKYTNQDILKNVFNSEDKGQIEVLKIPGNKQEMVFKLSSSDTPFGLIKIGDISDWIKNKLTGYVIIEKFDNESIFKKINQNDSNITILMGSRSFYEGWDSNRPNIILYINIGKGTDARKFVLQSIGRGVRIEPLPNKRKRMQFLLNNKEISSEDYDTIKDYIEPLETLFVYGTKAENLKEVIETLKQEKQEELLGDLFEINPDVKDKLLLIPVYKDSQKIIVEEQNVVKFQIHPNDYNLVKDYFNYLGEKICLVKYDCDLKVLNKIKEGFNGKINDYFILNNEEREIKNPDFLLKRIFNHFVNKVKEFDSFKKLEKEIIHFQKISISADKLNSLREKIEKVKKSRDKDLKITQLIEKYQKKEINIYEYTKKIEEISNNLLKEAETTYSANEKLKIKYLANHYYIPIALTESERADFIRHIIKNKSEVDFINQLEDYLQQKNNIFSSFDWWYFSKIDETLDEVYIPYYQPKTNKIEKFKPDFIFWLKKDNNYIILFIDPKGTEHTDGYRKIDGYSRIFETEKNGQKESRDFSYNGFTINTKLLLKPRRGIAEVLENYKRYWFDNFEDLEDKIKEYLPFQKKNEL